jgi:hypothetical protein
MFRKNYHFEGEKDCGETHHFYKMGITRKEAKVHAKHLIDKYKYKFVQYYAIGKIMREERAT